MLCDALIALLIIVFPLRYLFPVNPETAVERVINYFTFKGPFLSTEQPDVGDQELDAIVDDDYYYSGGAYYYVQPVDDDQE